LTLSRKPLVSSNFSLFCQGNPNIPLAVLWDFKDLYRLQAHFSAIPNFRRAPCPRRSLRTRRPRSSKGEHNMNLGSSKEKSSTEKSSTDEMRGRKSLEIEGVRLDSQASRVRGRPRKGHENCRRASEGEQRQRVAARSASRRKLRNAKPPTRSASSPRFTARRGREMAQGGKPGRRCRSAAGS
jgi:hypothetical protein